MREGSGARLSRSLLALVLPATLERLGASAGVCSSGRPTWVQGSRPEARTGSRSRNMEQRYRNAQGHDLDVKSLGLWRGHRINFSETVLYRRSIKGSHMAGPKSAAGGRSEFSPELAAKLRSLMRVGASGAGCSGEHDFRDPEPVWASAPRPSWDPNIGFVSNSRARNTHNRQNPSLDGHLRPEFRATPVADCGPAIPLDAPFRADPPDAPNPHFGHRSGHARPSGRPPIENARGRLHRCTQSRGP